MLAMSPYRYQVANIGKIILKWVETTFEPATKVCYGKCVQMESASPQGYAVDMVRKLCLNSVGMGTAIET